MKHNKKVLSCFMAMAMAAAMVPSTGLLSVKDIVTVDAAAVYTENKTGNIDGYDFELWKDRGNTSMTLLGGGAFSCEWSNINNCLFRTGKKLGSTKKYQDYNGIYIDYDVDYSPNGNSYMCVYGWTEQPTVEYYIVETWGSWRPPGQAQSLGTVYANGGAYDIYKTMRYDQPSIHGTETFAQYWSVRQQKPVMNGNNVKGRISVSKHFAAWEKAGLQMGKMYEVALNIEGYQSSGKATVKSHVLTMNNGDGDNGAGDSEIIHTEPPYIPEQPEINGIEINGKGNGISDDFEGSGSLWAPRGNSVKLLLTGDMKHSGSKSLAVTGRENSWNGVTVTSSKLKAGETYTFSASVAYKNSYISSAGFEFGLQYDLNNETHYDNLGSAASESGEWTDLSGIINVPSGAENISLYIQTAYTDNDTPSDLIDFYIDDVKFSGDSSSSDSDTPAVTTPPTSDSPASSGNISSSDLMTEAKKNFTSNVPADVKSGDKGKTSKISYYSKKAQRNKPANVWLPPNYSENKKYPVLYMNHGVMGGEDDLLTGWSIREMASNLIEKGEVQPFIIVFTQMYTDPGSERPAGITQESMDHYDDFLYDLTESLMPYMSEHYSVAEGRENTAVAGFSMGGRESLYIGMMACDKIGYVCASSPAPGIVPAKDMFLNHRGSMTESEFRFRQEPYLLMIGGGTADNVVGTFPKQYHELYDKNGVDNIWFEVSGGGHDASVGTPLFYNYFKNLFKASSSDSHPDVTPDKVIGDVDGNGSVTSADLAKLMQALIGTASLSDEQKTNADLNSDGKISVIDLIMLKNILL